MFPTGQSLNAEPMTPGLSCAPHQVRPAPSHPLYGERQETEGLAYCPQHPFPSHPCHSHNFSKMQISLHSMQMRPKSQSYLPSGPTTITGIGLCGTRPGCPAWGIEPVGVSSCFPTTDSVSSPGGLGPLPAGTGVLERAWTGSGPH